jgi:hypothetical protein
MRRWVGLLGVILPLLCACGHGQMEQSQARKTVYNLLNNPLADWADPPRSVRDALPGSRFQRGLDSSLADMLVTGTVSNAEILDINSPMAPGIQFYDLTLQVDAVVCATIPVGDEVHFSFVTPGPPGIGGSRAGWDAGDAMRGFGRMAVFLARPYRGNAELLDLAAMDGPLSHIGPGGTVPWPKAHGRYARGWLHGLTTLDDLRKACPT